MVKSWKRFTWLWERNPSGDQDRVVCTAALKKPRGGRRKGNDEGEEELREERADEDEESIGLLEKPRPAFKRWPIEKKKALPLEDEEKDEDGEDRRRLKRW